MKTTGVFDTTKDNHTNLEILIHIAKTKHKINTQENKIKYLLFTIIIQKNKILWLNITQKELKIKA